MADIDIALDGKLAALAARYGAAVPQAGPWNDTIALMHRHRSVRGYRPDPPPPGTLETLVAAAQSAATSSNLQTWSVVAIADPGRKARLARIAGGQKHIEQCPLFLAWIADLSRLERVGQAAGRTLEGLPCLDEHAALAQDVGGAQHVGFVVDPERDVVQPPAPALDVDHVGHLVVHLRRTEPGADLAAAVVVEHALVQAQAQGRLGEGAVGADVAAEQRQVVDAPHVDAAACVAHRQVLQRRLERRRRAVRLLAVVDLHQVAVRVMEAEARAAAVVAIGPAEAQVLRLDRLHAPLQGGWARCAPGDAADAGLRRRGQLEGAGGVVAVTTQPGRAAALVHQLQPQYVDEIAQALVEPGGLQFHRAQVGDVVDRLVLGRHGSSARFPALS